MHPVRGGMQDVNYWKYGCYEITFEIYCCESPPSNELETIWEQNKLALVEFVKMANTGVRGLVKYKNGFAAKYISVQIDAREPIFKTSQTGEYFALLLPGVYKLTFLLNCDPVDSRMITIDSNTNLLVFNVELNDTVYFRSFYYTLDKYATFCTDSKKPVECVLN